MPPHRLPAASPRRAARRALPPFYRQVHTELHGFTPQNISNTVWAFAISDVVEPDLLLTCSKYIMRSLNQDPGEWGACTRTQLHQWQLWLSLEGRAWMVRDAFDPSLPLSSYPSARCSVGPPSASAASPAHPRYIR